MSGEDARKALYRHLSEEYDGAVVSFLLRDKNVSAELEQASIPPFALQTLVENSLKHSIAPRRTGGELRVLAEAYGEAMRLEVWDDGPGFTAADGLAPTAAFRLTRWRRLQFAARSRR